MSRCKVLAFDQRRFRPAVSVALNPSNVVLALQRHVPERYTFRKMSRRSVYLVLDDNFCVAGMLSPVPCCPLPDPNASTSNGVSLRLGEYLTALGASSDPHKSLVTVWHRHGALIGGIDRSGEELATFPLKEFSRYGGTAQKEFSFNALQNRGTSMDFFIDVMSYIQQGYDLDVRSAAKFLKVRLGGKIGSGLFDDFCRIHRQSEESPIDFNDARWVDTELVEKNEAVFFARGRGVDHVAMRAALSCGLLVMDKDYSLADASTNP